MSKKHIVIPIFIPHKGCPFDCIYCNQKNISGQKDEITDEKIRKVIQDHIESAPPEAFVEIGFYGGSFTGIDRQEQKKLLSIANEYIDSGYVKGIRLSTRPDYIDEDVLEYLKFYNVSAIELGVQSLDEDVLQRSSRGHSTSHVYKASQLIKERGFILGIQTMLGLPGDNMDRAVKTAQEVIALSPNIVRIYPTLVIKDTYLEQMYKQGKYSPLSLEEAVSLCAIILELYRDNNINVIRVGLQPTESINEGMDVVAGPFHPAFRQLVESRMALNAIEKYIVKNNLMQKREIVICTDSRRISDVIGQKKINVKYLKEKYSFDNVKIITNCDKCELCDIKY